MRADQVSVAEGQQPGEARLAFRAEIVGAISGIIDRDVFLQRLARRVAHVTGTSRIAIYTRSDTTGDLLLRSSTVPAAERIPQRVVAPSGLTSTVGMASDGTIPETLQQAICVPIGDVDPLGALVLYSPFDGPPPDVDPATLSDIAEEIAPAIAVAEHHHAVKQSSVIDLTTGVYYHWYLAQRFEEEIARARRTNSRLTVILVTLLDFDLVQDRAGFTSSDTLLRELASEYVGLTRIFDVVGMRARSEFAILLPDTDIHGATTVIRRIHERSKQVIQRLEMDHVDAPVRVVTGAGSFPADGDHVATVLMAAEHRLNQNEIFHRRMIERERR